MCRVTSACVLQPRAFFTCTLRNLQNKLNRPIKGFDKCGWVLSFCVFTQTNMSGCYKKKKKIMYQNLHLWMIKLSVLNKHYCELLIVKRTNSPNLSFGKWISLCVAGGGGDALTAPCARWPGWSCGRVSTAAARWKCRWRPGWGRDWGPAPRWSPARRAALRGSRASPAVISCQLSRPPSGSGSQPQRWRGRAGGCGLRDKIQSVKQRLTFTYLENDWNHFSK